MASHHESGRPLAAAAELEIQAISSRANWQGQ
jgi:hypothetical protein